MVAHDPAAWAGTKVSSHLGFPLPATQHGGRLLRGVPRAAACWGLGLRAATEGLQAQAAGARAVLFVWTPGTLPCSALRPPRSEGEGPVSSSHQGPATHTRRANFTTFPSPQPPAQLSAGFPDSANEYQPRGLGMKTMHRNQPQTQSQADSSLRGPAGVSAGTVVSESLLVRDGARACCPSDHSLPKQGSP